MSMETVMGSRGCHAPVRGTIRSWLALLRLPNLFTVPGDVVAGLMLAAAPARCLLSLIPASLCLYASGLILNDWFDRGQDLAGRPERPLPSGQISPRAALAAASALALAALVLAALAGLKSLATAVVLLSLILLYNGGARRIPAAGFLVMGLCRGANVLLGASPALPHLPAAVLGAAALIASYTVAVSAVAHMEDPGPGTGARGPGVGARAPGILARWAPPIVAVAGLALFVSATGISWMRAAASAAAFAGIIAVTASSGTGAGAARQRTGGLLRCLIPLQAALAAAGPQAGFIPAAMCILWPISAAAGRKYRGS